MWPIELIAEHTPEVWWVFDLEPALLSPIIIGKPWVVLDKPKSALYA